MPRLLIRRLDAATFAGVTLEPGELCLVTDTFDLYIGTSGGNQFIGGASGLAGWGILDTPYGGTGQDFSAATGVPVLTAGVMAADAGLADLADVGDTTPTAGNVLQADGDSWESGVLALGLADLSDVGDATPTAGNVLRADGDSFESAALDHADLANVGTGDHHAQQHGIDAGADHTGVSGATENNLLSFTAGGLPKDSGVAASVPVTRTVIVQVLAYDTALTTGDAKAYFIVPELINGFNLIKAHAHVHTVSSSGLPTFQIHNETDAQDMLSTLITIDANELDSKDAAAPPVINTSYDDVATGDEIRVDCDVAGTGTKGCEIRLEFQKP